jgi:SAM-dependent methyltransferase
MRRNPKRAGSVANFLPLKHYMFYCLDRFIEQYGIRGPFLEIGCGKGETSAYLAKKGWSGTAIDDSDAAIAQARENLKPFPGVAVKQQPLSRATGTYACILLWDVLEHIEDDRQALRAIGKLLSPGGHLVVAVPSNPHEWRWDDDFYGHFRRYTVADLNEKLSQAGMESLMFWDFTYPVFWAMRRMYTRIKAPAPLRADKASATKASATVNAWDWPIVSRLLDRSAVLWYPVHRLQFQLFRNATGRGHEFFALARKPVVS